MDHFINIYQHHTNAYQRMISREDIDGQLLASIKEITPLAGLRILDVGSGTGRLPQMLHTLVRSVTAADLYLPMLREQSCWQQQSTVCWPLVNADIRNLPFASRNFDITFAGWALGHTTSWHEQDWPAHMDRMLREMARVTIPGGHLIIFETLGTGTDSPLPPTPAHAAFYDLLINEYGFTQKTLQTDYQFDSVEQAVEHCRFFFGDELAEKIIVCGWSRLPEFTGMWHKEV